MVFLLLAVTITVYSKTFTNDFINYDDDLYVTSNTHVQTGLTIENIGWAFTSIEVSNWHPLTWLSHMADCQLFGLNPAGHHAVNILFHSINTVLLFFLMLFMTKKMWGSALVAALFALHPTHVESVAWVAERKDVLSTFFFMLTLMAYLAYTRRQGIVRYSVVCLLFTLGLMAKPMLVTLPCLLLLLDFWPLGRIQFNRKSADIVKTAENRCLHPSAEVVFDKAGPRKDSIVKFGFCIEHNHYLRTIVRCDGHDQRCAGYV